MTLISTQYIFKEAFNTIRPIKSRKLIQIYIHNKFLCLKYLFISDPINRQGEYAVITGGNRGIGWHTVKKLVDSGMKVIVGMSVDALFSF